MIDKQEDLSEFEDYLDQFEESVKFDSETCPVCGIDLSSTINIESSPYTEFIILNSEAEAKNLAKVLSENKIPVNVEKRISSNIDEVVYEYILLVPFNRLNEARDKLKFER